MKRQGEGSHGGPGSRGGTFWIDAKGRTRYGHPPGHERIIIEFLDDVPQEDLDRRAVEEWQEHK